MSEHLTPHEEMLVRERKLPVNDLSDISAHLADCNDCRRQLSAEAELQVAAAFLQNEWLNADADVDDSDLCYTTAELADYAQESLAEAETERIAEHLSNCADCEQALAEVRRINGDSRLTLQYAPPGRNTSWAVWTVPAWRYSLAGAAIVLLLGLFGYAAFYERPASPASTTTINLAAATASPSPTPLAPDAALFIKDGRDGNAQIRLETDGRLFGLEAFSETERKAVAQVLSSEKLSFPKVFEDLRSNDGELMGAQPLPNSFLLLQPVGTVTATLRPTFRWQPLAGAESYRVKVFDRLFRPVASSEPLTDTVWELPASLQRGNFYHWQVLALRNGKEILSPGLDQPGAKFFVLDRLQTQQLARAKQSPNPSHLLLAVLYARAGMPAEAKQELRHLLRLNRNSSPQIQKTLQKLLKQLSAHN